jgi:hypothetical protein
MQSNTKFIEDDIQQKADSLYEIIIKKPEVSEALNLLDKLPDNLIYHNKGHTLDVLRETILFAITDGINEEVIEQLCISAAWHDVGYIKQYENNEPVAVELFKQSRAFQNISEEQRNEVIRNILDTRMIMIDDNPHLRQTDSKYGYVLDADVSNFGREDYFDKGIQIAEELGIDLSDIDLKRKFYQFAIKLLENHEWKTPSAMKLRQSQKEINLKMMRGELERI